MVVFVDVFGHLAGSEADGKLCGFGPEGCGRAGLFVADGALCTGLDGGDFALGTLFMYLFFVTIGASANLASLAGDALVLVVLAMIIIGVHMVVLAIGTKLFRIDLAEALVASNACIMGPATAAAIAAGQGWRHQVTPGLLVGILGYVIANFLGVAVTELLG